MKKVIYGKTVKSFEYNPITNDIETGNTTPDQDKNVGNNKVFWGLLFLGIVTIIIASKLRKHRYKDFKDTIM